MDTELKRAVRDGLGGVTMAVPVPEIIARGQVLRRRRRILAATATGCTAVVAAAGVIAVMAPHPVPPPAGRTRSTTGPGSSAALTAWTVTKTGGRVNVTIRQMTDPAGLQAKLRAAGVRVVITTSLAWPAACHEWRHGRYEMGSKVIRLANRTGLPGRHGTEFFLDPSAIPDAAALWLGMTQTGKPSGVVGPPGPIGSGYLAATAACLHS